MNNTQYFSLGLLTLYLVVLVLATFKSAKRESTSDYMIGERKIGVIPTMAQITGNLRDGAGLAAWVSLGYAFGFGALWLTTGLAVALLIMGWFAPRIRKDAEENDYLTVSQMLAQKVGIHTSRLSSIIIAGTAFLYAAAQIYVSGRLFASQFGFSDTLGILITAGFVCIYLLIGGYKATILTGIIQWIILMLIIGIPFAMTGTIPSVAISSIFSTDLVTALGFFGISFLVALCSADLWQLMFSSIAPKAARQSLFLSVPVYYLISIGMVFFAVAVRTIIGSDVSPPEAFFQLFATAKISSFIIAVLGVFVLAAVMSTLDSQIFLFTSTVTRAVLPKGVDTSDPKMQYVNRIAIVAVMVFLVIIAAGIGNIIEFLFAAVTLSTVLAPILLLILIFRRNFSKYQDIGFAISLIIASLAYAYMFYSGWFRDITWTLAPAGISALLCITVLLVTRIVFSPSEISADK